MRAWLYRVAMKIVTSEIRRDEALFYGWQANIAMAFYDAYRGKQFLGDEERTELYKISNEAAVNFLKQLVKS